MSYQVIARKWRPQTFEAVTGQEVITQTLRNALEYDRLHHAYLFSGARGVGKTTTARILAKALNCHKTDKPTLTPCLLTDPDACPSCIEISESRSMDVLEIDAASHTGIGDVRETILDNINFNPARDRYRVFIIDEVHQLSKPAFNALLKTIEEPPANVLFVMATTELHKVPETIASRCQEFQFRTISIPKIFDRLKMIAEAEKIDISDDALRELARSGEGSMRDAQSNFDQVISFSSDKISATDVTNALGFAGVDILAKIVEAIAEKQPKLVLTVVDDLITRGHDLRNFCRDLLGLLRDMMVFKVAGEDTYLFEGAVFPGEQMRVLSASFTETDLLRFFNSLCETEASLREAVHPRYVLEVGLVKLIEMRRVASIESILERLDAISSAIPSRPTSEIAAAAPRDVPAEKKTLKSDPSSKPATKEDFHNFHEPPNNFTDPPFDESEIMSVATPIPAVPPAAAPVRTGYTASPTRLRPLSSEELEHIDDQRLDNAFETKLAITGDDLMPLAGVDILVRSLLGISDVPLPKTPVPAANGSSAGAAPAFDIAKFREEIAPTAPPVDLPILGENPSEADLLDYSAAHPSVRAALRVFRAKIVEVKKA
ncbi:MAG TPA: DNA polymerase III subunit gamma/tau [Pyrinomonadaceae bacterium]|nr:DNA polymerase III subunit gamma/tau [Pyrinomonadaceae bacterium]